MTDIGTPIVFNNRKAVRLPLIAELIIARTVTRNFSSSLNDAFALDSSLEGLAQSVEQKKQAVTSQGQELEALERRLKETEEKLRQKTSKPSSSSGKANSSTTPHRRQPLASAFAVSDNQAKHQWNTESRTASEGVPSPSVARWEGLLPQERGSGAR